MALHYEKKKTDFARLIGCIILCEIAGATGSVFTFPMINTWYSSINKPFFNPPNWIFGPVWTALFLLMGISLYLVLEKGLQKKEVKKAASIFGVQLLMNILWSVLFFGLMSPFLAFIEIIFLWLAIAFTIKSFYPTSKKAAWLLVPYICWVSFALILNFAVWMLNP
ncbi:MAG: tryptophan-rich sensory protein [Candidatus Diapherotrites archaeon]|nr:tryptophan-rich sensory protein [Candidatus Diapherotrites archaeon]